MSQAFECDLCHTLFGENFKRIILSQPEGLELVASIQFGKRAEKKEEGPYMAFTEEGFKFLRAGGQEWEGIDICPSCVLQFLRKVLVVVEATAVAGGKPTDG